MYHQCQWYIADLAAVAMQRICGAALRERPQDRLLSLSTPVYMVIDVTPTERDAIIAAAHAAAEAAPPPGAELCARVAGLLAPVLDQTLKSRSIASSSK